MLGLAALHAHGVAHRDYKPANVMVTGDGRTTLVDYGIAVPIGRLTSATGTPLYMAPEQWAGAVSSAATDVYAATATFVECLLGHPAFAGDTVPALYQQHLTVPPPLDELPEPFRPLVEAGLAKDPAVRIQSAARRFSTGSTPLPRQRSGPGWEHRGKAELAGRAALLAFLFAHAQTRRGRGRPEPKRTWGTDRRTRPAGADDVGERLQPKPRRRVAGRSVDLHRGWPAQRRRRLVRGGLGLLALAAAGAAIVGNASPAARTWSRQPSRSTPEVSPGPTPPAVGSCAAADGNDLVRTRRRRRHPRGSTPTPLPHTDHAFPGSDGVTDPEPRGSARPSRRLHRDEPR